MDPIKQRIAIAEACAWTKYPGRENWETPPWGVVPGMDHKLGQSWKQIPDYLTDLNAMHEAEKLFYPDGKQSERYAAFLLDVLEVPHAFVGTARCAFLTNHATAAQRAEAFLRTIGKWEDEKLSAMLPQSASSSVRPAAEEGRRG